MKVNDRELSDYAMRDCVMEGRLHHKKLGGNLPQVGFKERWFKLKANILFYFNLNESGKINENLPSGALILENCSVAYEMLGETAFSFSLTFKDDLDRKHIFSGRTEDHINRWVKVLKDASYEFWRARLLMLQIQLSSLTGKDPLLMYHRSDGSKLPITIAMAQENPTEKVKVSSKSSFRSYVGSAKPKKSETPLTDFHFDMDHFGNGLDAIGRTQQYSEKKEKTSSSSSIIMQKTSITVLPTPPPSPQLTTNQATSIRPRPRPLVPERPPRANKTSAPVTTNLIDL